MTVNRMGVETSSPLQELLSVVVPAFNEAEGLHHFHARLSAVLLPMQAEIVYVNDGSSDATLEVMRQLAGNDGRVAIVDLSRNFGKEIALTAGLDHARGDAVVVIDADLQDPPELITEMIRRWREGYDVVYAKRTARDGESWLKKLTAFAFYRLMQRAGRVRIPQDTGDYRLLSRRAIVALGKLREQHRFMKGLFAWIGYPQVAVPYRREPRYAGNTKWNYWHLWNFALEGITSFTTAPLKMATYLGLVTALGAFAYAAIIVYKTLMFGDPARGYPSLMVVVLFLGGVQLITIGILGEYIGRMFDETKNRPLYLVQEYRPADYAQSLSEMPVAPNQSQQT
ncbi:MAG: glycosyltransferase family 2 protein [Rhodocyclaceae bacterium]|nr:glycosyltransferase family 2 protein [Rhodocyclaceae bacterium]